MNTPVTRDEVIQLAARLYTLGRACSFVALPLEITAAWMQPADLAAFTNKAEEYLRGLLGLFDEYLADNPGAMERCTRDTREITEFGLADARKQLALLARIADGSIELDIGPNYLPPEFLPEGFDENEPGDGDED